MDGPIYANRGDWRGMSDVMQVGEVEGNDGTQAIRRAATILRYIAQSAAHHGPTLNEIGAAVGLSRSTTHRILKSLVDLGLASYDAESRRYMIGLLSYELGLAVSDEVLKLTPWSAAVDRVAHRTGATAYLMRRSGVEAVCVYKREAASVVRVIPVEVGQRRPLGVGAGATALLATLDDRTIERLVSIAAPTLDRFSDLDADRIHAIIAEIRTCGFAVSRGRVFGSVFGLGLAVPNGSEPSTLALSIAAHMSEAEPEKIERWKSVLREEVDQVLAAAEPQP